jgi:hypothetical protein
MSVEKDKTHELMSELRKGVTQAGSALPECVCVCVYGKKGAVQAMTIKLHMN